MEKTLRSLIHEKFDLDLRYEIELLSRRRDIINEEKQEELIKLLQARNIEGIVPLGPGTNRYAFKLDGFVIKVATDHDGKIDNLKEFKMAKRLYPYVTKTYEVSENGTILVAEYIQPFESFAEMCKYADQIREILTKLSAVYLIGDVGITPNNFANWGLRIGTQDPVCLDFAYVYEVSSELFLCQYCNAHAMLSPNKDFTELHCTNPGCGRKYLFEDIRAKIGNDIHRHEIGDLSLEGYRMIGSHAHTVLSEQRSNYLIRRRKKDKEKEEKQEDDETPFVDNFVMPHQTNLGGIEMSENITNAMNNATAMAANRGNVIRVQARATVVSTPPAGTPIPGPLSGSEPKIPKNSMYGVTKPSSQATIIQGAQGLFPEEEAKEADSTLAFSGEMKADPVMPTGVETPPSVDPAFTGIVATDAKKPYATVQPPIEGVNPKTVTAKASVVKTTVVTPPPIRTADQTQDEPNPEPVHVEASEELAENPTPEETTQPEDDGQYKFPDNIREPDVLRDMISNVTNRMKHELHMAMIFDEVKAGIRDKKMLPETFYKNVQNAAFRSLVSFCNFSEHEEPREDGKGNRLVFTPPEDLYGDYLDTLVFIVEFNKFVDNHRNMSYDDLMAKYREEHPDYPGIQRGWIPRLEQRMIKKMPIDVADAKRIASLIADMYCVPEGFVKSEPEPDPAPETPTPQDPPAGAEAEPPKKVWTDSELREYAVKSFDEGKPITDIIDAFDDEIAERYVIEVIKEFGVRHYNSELDCSNRRYIMVAKFIINIDDKDYTVCGAIDLEHDVFRFMMGNIALHDVFANNHKELVMALVTLDLGKISKDCAAMVQSIVESKNASAQPAADILQSGDDEDDDEDDVDPISQSLHVNVYPDENFDIIKVNSADAFGEIAIPFYAQLANVSIENPPSIVDDRNGIWDWLTHMVPDLMFRTTRPEYFMKVNTDDPDEEEVHIVILDEDRGVYTMGIYYLSGVYVRNDDGDMEPCFDMELLAKINRVICEDTAYGRISHLQRSLSMEQLINTEEYVLNDVFRGRLNDDDEDEDEEDGSNPPDPNNLTPEERAALDVIMHGSKALPPDASQEDKDFADKMRQSAFNAMGIPVPSEADQLAYQTAMHSAYGAEGVDPAGEAGDSTPPTSEAPIEETFEVNVPPTQASAVDPKEPEKTGAPEPAPIDIVRRKAH